ncbi:MAG: hypothetical protein D6696_13650 [Acidobacteria bacterium]|nr:MAG: hypothetical protein D6696_13650 [Acidobacteriota bacterium]
MNADATSTIDLGADLGAQSEIAKLVDPLFVLMNTVGSHGREHPLSVRAAESLRKALEATDVPFALQLVAGGLFCNRVLVPLDVERYHKLAQLSHAFNNLSVHELTVEALPELDGVLTLGDALGKARIAPCQDLEHRKIPGLRWREIPAAQRGVHADSVAPEVFAVAQVAQAIAAVERIVAAPEEPWPWSAGVGVIRRLERAYDADRSTFDRALELAPGSWSVARRAVCAAALVLQPLIVLESTLATRRAAAHAILGLAACGFKPRDCDAIEEAASRLLFRMLAAPIHARSGVEPHRLRVCALVHHFAEQDDRQAPRLEIMKLIHLVYGLEGQRCAGGVDFVLSRADLFAHAVAELDRRPEGAWVRMLIKAVGELPPGAWVRLPDGRVGTVLGPGSSGDPRRPEVLIGGRKVEPPGPVELVPPPDAHGRRS